MNDVDAIRARWAAVWGVGDWTRWTAADIGSVCRYSTVTLTAVLHAPDDVRTLLHELRVVRAHRDWLTDHVDVWRANTEQAYRMVDALTVERDAARALACDLVSQQPGPADDEDEIRAAELEAEILILDTGDGWAAFAWGEHDVVLFRTAAEAAALQSTGETQVARSASSGVAEECDVCAAMVGNTGGYIVFGGPHLDDGADDTWEHGATCTDDECEEDCDGRRVSPHGGGRRGVATWAYLTRTWMEDGS